MSERITEAWFHRIKAATRDLVKACGGIERAAEIALVGKSTMGRFQHSGEEDIIPLTAVLALEADCGRPYITRVMADLNGRGLTDPEAERDVAGTLATHHNNLMHKFAELTTSVASATADGVVSPAEAEIVDRDAAEMERRIGDLRAKLAAKKAGHSDEPGADIARLRPRGA